MSTNSSLSWIDATAVANLVKRARLVKGHEQAPAYGGGSKAMLAAPRPSSATGPSRSMGTMRRNFLSHAHKTQDAADAASEVENTPSFPDFHPPHGPLGQRLNAFVDWLYKHFACLRVFIADGDGLPLAQRDSNIEFIGVATVLIDATRQMRGQLELPEQGAITLDLGSRECLQLLQVQLSYQNISLGMVMRGPLDRPALEHVREALGLALIEADQLPSNPYYGEQA